MTEGCFRRAAQPRELGAAAGGLLVMLAGGGGKASSPSAEGAQLTR
jgi:hypothetical protein